MGQSCRDRLLVETSGDGSNLRAEETQSGHTVVSQPNGASFANMVIGIANQYLTMNMMAKLNSFKLSHSGVNM